MSVKITLSLNALVDATYAFGRALDEALDGRELDELEVSEVEGLKSAVWSALNERYKGSKHSAVRFTLRRWLDEIEA